MGIQAKPFGTTRDGEAITQYTIKNKNGYELRCINYGCIITHLLVPGQEGTAVDVVLGFDDLAGYEEDTAFLGSFVGRYAGRIEGAAFALGGKTYRLPANEGNNHLHGVLHKKVFKAEELGNTVAFTYLSPDGEDGFPGELWMAVQYTLTDENDLLMDFRVRTDKDTYLNLTQHSYFNMAGEDAGSLMGQTLRLPASGYLPVRADMCPLGTIVPVADTPFDFNEIKPILRDIDADDPQLQLAGGYDHCYVLNKKEGPLYYAACLRDSASGRRMRVYTSQPTLQLYTSNALPAAVGKGGRPLAKRSAVCLETQRYNCLPPADPDFANTLLSAGDEFHAVTVLKFDTK